MVPSEPQYSTTTKLARIAWLSERDPLKKFDVLMHLFNKESLRACVKITFLSLASFFPLA